MPYLGQAPTKGDENNFKILDNISSYTLTFDGSDAAVVSAANDTITSLTHRFVQGQRVTYNKGGGTVITGLSDGVYYIIKHDHNTIKLATSASNATNGIAVNITGVGAGSSHTLNVAFDGVNTKFKATHTNGQKARITRSAQLVISINGVIQQPHDSAAPSTGFGFDLDGTIVFSQAPVAGDVYWAHVLTNNNVTFDISDNHIDRFTGNASTTAFNLSKSPPDNRNVLVTIDGVVQYPNDPDGTVRAYNVVENVLTFTNAPATGAEIQVRHIGFAGATSGGGGVTNFYGRTGSVVLKNTDNIVANNAEFAGNLTVNGTMTTLDTKLTEVDQLEVAANNTTVGVAITQSGSGDILNLYDGSTEVFSVIDGGNILAGGTSIPGYSGADDLTIGSETGHHGITIRSGATNNGGLFFSDDTVGGSNSNQWAAGIEYNHPSSDLRFYVGNTWRFSFQGVGHYIPYSDSTINIGNSSKRFLNVFSNNLNLSASATIAGTADINGDLDVDGHTNLDNVSIAGVTTMSSNLRVVGDFTLEDNYPSIFLKDTDSDSDFMIQNQNGTFTIYDSTNNADRFEITSTGTVRSPHYTLQSQSPSLTFNDTNHDSDYMWQNANGLFKIFDNTNLADRFAVNSSGSVFVYGNELYIGDSIIHNGDVDTKIRFPSNDTVTVETGGNERFRIASDGQNTIYSGAHDKGLDILPVGNSQETRFRIQAKNSSGTEHTFSFNAKQSANALHMSGTGPMCFIGSQNVGVQNGVPTSPLHVGSDTNNSGVKATLFVGPGTGDGMFHLRGGSPTVLFDRSGSGYAKILTDQADLAISNGVLGSEGTELVRITTGGNLGIGITNPDERLQVIGDIKIGSPVNTARNLIISGDRPTNADLGNIIAKNTGGNIAAISFNTGTRSQKDDGVIDFKTSPHSGQPLLRVMRLTTGRQMIFGITEAHSTVLGAYGPKVQIEATDVGGSSLLLNRDGNDHGGCYLFLGHGRGGNGLVQDGDNLGNLMFVGGTGSNFRGAANISCTVDVPSGGSVSNTSMPGALIFSTSNNNQNSPVEAMRIRPDGRIVIGGSTAVSFTPNASADDLVVGATSNSNRGITILSGVNNRGTIYFADTDDDNAGQIDYNQGNHYMTFSTNGEGRVVIDNAGNLIIDATGVGNASTYARNIVISGSSNNGMTIHTTDTSGANRKCCLFFGDGTSVADMATGMLFYDHNGDYLHMSVNGGGTGFARSARLNSDGTFRLDSNPSAVNSVSLRIQSHKTRTVNDNNGIAFFDEVNHTQAAIYVQKKSTSNASSDLVFSTSSGQTTGTLQGIPEKLRIDSTGQLLSTCDNNGQIIHRFYNKNGTAGSSAMTVEHHFNFNRSNGQMNLSAARIVAGKEREWVGAASNQDGFLAFYTCGNETVSEKVRISSAGNVGINETSPQQQLHVHDDTNYQGILINGNSAPRIAFARSTTTTGEWSVGIDGTNGNNFVINRSNDNSNRYLVISNGQTTSNQNTAINGILFNNEIVSITSTNDDSTSHVSISARNAAAGYGNYFIVGVSGNTYFGAGANSYSSNPSGNNINGGTTIRVYGGVSSNAYNDAHRFGRNTDGSIVLFQSAGGTEGSIAISGSQTNYNQSSDYRLKENIVNITDGITRLKQLQPRRFNFIKHPSKTIDGFIAHEVHSIVPQAVTGTKDETFSKDDEDNNIKAGDPKYQQMDASKLIPLLTAALQEAITEIETLKTKVAALEGS